MSATSAAASTTKASATIPPSSQTLLCQECHNKPCLYACPRCRFRSCCLSCCVAHKKRTGCNGKRDRTAFLPLAKMTDATLQSDYHFLENVLHQVDGGKRLMRHVGAAAAHASNQKQQHGNNKTDPITNDDNDSKPKHPLLKQAGDTKCTALFTVEPPMKRPRIDAALPAKWRKLVERAQERNTTLLLMPAGMERHKANTSCFIAKQNLLCWRVEFVVHLNDSNDKDKSDATILTIAKLSEEANLREELRRLLLQQENMNDWTMLIKKLPCPSNKALYVELLGNDKITLRDALCNMTVIEFPTIHVVRKQHLERYPRFIQEV